MSTFHQDTRSNGELLRLMERQNRLLDQLNQLLERQNQLLERQNQLLERQNQLLVELDRHPDAATTRADRRALRRGGGREI